MYNFIPTFFITFLILISPLLTNGRRCSERFFTEVKKINITQNCRQKTTLGAEFGWNFDQKSRRLDIAFGARIESDSGWIAWGVNPEGRLMEGTRALIGLKQRNGSLEWHKYNITKGTKIGCPLLPADEIGLDVRDFRFEYWEGIDYYVITAAIVLPNEYNASRINLVCQIGGMAVEKQPLMHPRSLRNFNCAETVDLVRNRVLSFRAHRHRRLRTAHGILNIIGWGTLLPIGAIVARYFKRFPLQWARWDVFHICCQSVGYIIGTTGWAIGIWLGKTSKHYCFRNHRILGILIFTFTTIQMFALRLKPKRSDEYRTYWNMYHHFLGYALLAMISVNIFEGIKILEPDHVWKWAYIGVLGAWGTVVLAFEISTWTKFLYYRKSPR